MQSYGYAVRAYFLKNKPEHTTIGDILQQVAAEARTITFPDRLCRYFPTVVARSPKTTGRLPGLAPKFRNSIELVSNVLGLVPPL